MKRIGFLINGGRLGGQAGLKGSDDQTGRELALRKGYLKTAPKRARQCVETFLKTEEAGYEILAPEGEMGGSLLRQMGISFRPLGELPSGQVTTREDTIRAAREIQRAKADLLPSAAATGRPEISVRRWGVNFPFLESLPE